MSRKYSQKGYQQGGDEKPERPKPQSPRSGDDGPRSPNMTAFRETMRCGMCGADAELALEGVHFDSACTKCKADLRTCRNCVNFDPAAHFQCRAPVELRVTGKTTRTECPQFSPRKRVEKQTTEARGPLGAGPSPGPRVSNDARAAFDKLFKR